RQPRKIHSLPENTTSPQSALPSPRTRELRYAFSASSAAGTKQATEINNQYGRDFSVGSEDSFLAVSSWRVPVDSPIGVSSCSPGGVATRKVYDVHTQSRNHPHRTASCTHP